MRRGPVVHRWVNSCEDIVAVYVVYKSVSVCGIEISDYRDKGCR